MRYDAEEALRQTLARAAALRERSRRRKRAALALGAGSCACALLVLGYELAAGGYDALSEAGYGAFLLPDRAGSYVLVGLLAFAAGAAVTLLCLRYRNGADPPDRLSRQPGGDDHGGETQHPGSRGRTGPGNNEDQTEKDPTERRENG